MLVATLSLTGCGGDGKQGNANALASLDTRLVNGAVPAKTVRDAASKSPASTHADGAAVLAAHRAIIAAHDPVAHPAAGAGGAVRSLAAMDGKAVGGCAGGDLRYGERWAAAMPEGLGIYPGAHLVEAAGTDSGRCALRVISFTTADSPQAVAARYTDSVRAAGFDAERQPCRTELRMGGTREGDGAAYMLFARRTTRGVTEVDIIATARPA